MREVLNRIMAKHTHQDMDRIERDVERDFHHERATSQVNTA